MKRTTSLLLAVLIALAASACSSTDSSSEESYADVTSTTTTTAQTAAPESSPESEPDTDPLPEFTGESGEYARIYTERIAEGSYTLRLTVSSDRGTSVSAKSEHNGGSSRVTVQNSGVDIEVYRIGDDLRILIPAMKAFALEDDALMATVALFKDYSLDPRAVLLSSEERSGLVCETYGVPVAANTPEGYQFNETLDNKVEYRCDKLTGKPREIIITSPLTGVTTVSIESLRYSCAEITLPDTTGWTQLGGKPDREQQVKMTMSLLGITDEMLAASDYTLAQLAEMSDDEMTAALVEIMKANRLE